MNRLRRRRHCRGGAGQAGAKDAADRRQDVPFPVQPPLLPALPPLLALLIAVADVEAEVHQQKLAEEEGRGENVGVHAPGVGEEDDEEVDFQGQAVGLLGGGALGCSLEVCRGLM